MERVGPYELHQRIGVGGMAEVWRGAHAPTGRPVAVKLVSLSSVREPRLVRALRSEVRIAARLRHPHVVRLYDQGTVRVSESSETLAAGAPWMVMALGSGSLEEREPATWGELAVVLEQMLGALGHAHARGVLHLDLKPANVLWTPHGVALADFGIARALDEAEVAPTGGTLGFMPPEQLEARTAALGPWSDLYAFGRTASALATGLRVPPGFDAFVARCTCTEPDERFAFAAEAAAVLRGFGDPSVVYVGAAEAGDDTFVFDDLATAAPASSLAPAAPCPVPSLSVPAHPPQAILPGHEPALGLFGLVEPPIMGRTEERRRLWRAVEAAVCGLGRVVVLSGPVGVGKTRLATWTARCAHEAGVARIVRVIHSAGRSPGTGVVELGRRLLGVEGLSPEARRARLLSPAGPRTSLVRRVLTDERVPMDEQVAVVGRLVIEASEERPLVLVLDDVHLDRGSLALLRFLARRPGRVLTLATNEDGPTDDVAATHLSLGPLDDATIGDLVRELVDAPRATVERVVARCGGSPLLAMQTLGDWVRRGALSVHDADDQRADWQARLSLLLADRAADDELASRVDVELSVFVQQFSGQHVLDDQLHHAFTQVGVGHFRIVLSRQHHRVDADNDAVLVTAGHLGFCVWTQPRQQARFAGFGLTVYQLVRERDRRWHQGSGFVAGVAEHQTLVAGALIFRLGTVDALVDVRRLLADDVHHAASGAVETDVGAGVADVADHVTNDLLQVDPRAGGHFASNDGNTGFDQGLNGNASVLVLSNDGVQHRIGDLVGDFVRMPFGHGLGGEKGVFAHLDDFPECYRW